MMKNNFTLNNKSICTIISILIILALGTGYLLDNYCKNNAVSVGYAGYAVNQNSLCSTSYFLWGEQPSFWLLPSYIIINLFEYIGINGGSSLIFNSLFWILINSIVLLLVFKKLKNPHKSFWLYLFGFITFLTIGGSTFMYGVSGYEIHNWEKNCSPVDKEIIQTSYDVCSLKYYKLKNSDFAINNSLNKCPSYLAADSYSGTDILRRNVVFENIYANSLIVSCLCKSDVEYSKIKEYLANHELRRIGRVPERIINDPEVACENTI